MTAWIVVAVCLGSPQAPHRLAETGRDAGDCLTRPSLHASGAQNGAGVAQDATQDDMVLRPGQPEFTVVNLPTTLRLPARRFAFRVGHRFGRDLTEGGFGELLENFFGLDSGALIGLELRYGMMPGWQMGINRTSDRTIQLFTQVNLIQRRGGDFSVDALATFEGTNNLRGSDPFAPGGEGQRSPALGGVVSHVFGRTAAVNATVAWINNTNPLPSSVADHDDTVLLGVGGRLRVTPTVYLVAEVAPRLGGYTPGTMQGSFGIEKRVGGHAFQLNFSNGIAMTLAQVARGAGDSNSWFIGFNINRKFF